MLQRRAIGVRHGERVQRRIHVSRIDRDHANALGGEFGIPDAAEMLECRLARAVRAPVRIRVDRGVARHVDDDPAARFPGRSGECAEQRLRQPERSEHVGGERRLECFARGVGERRERHRAEARRIVDEHVDAAAPAERLQRNAMDRVLVGDIADDAERFRLFARDALDAIRRARDERDVRAALAQFADERTSESRRAAGDENAQAAQAVSFA